MRLLILLLLLPFLAHAADRDDYGRIKRDPKVIRIFKATVPCPATGKPEKRCPGYVVDHIQPLCAGGPDKVENLQWQTVEDAKAKDRLERQECEKLAKVVPQNEI